MERLWAPWRVGYITGEQKIDGCLFCVTFGERMDEENLILHRGETCFVIMNRYPYNNGHLMVVPIRHVGEVSGLTAEEQVEILSLTGRCITAITTVMHADGFNVGMNLGKVAGAGVADHLHLHIVPRWGGDTNFMPVLGETKVISEGLSETYKKLKGVF
ncbi:MAG: HIT domain-containing protein [Candidatus Latescibacteria bacterium]|nr:HIT domain-containing protein [Candidatus Latescibacterota bacterium]